MGLGSFNDDQQVIFAIAWLCFSCVSDLQSKFADPACKLHLEDQQLFQALSFEAFQEIEIPL